MRSNSIGSWLRHFRRSDLYTALIIVLLWKIVITTIGFIFDTLQGGAFSLLDHTVRWDAGWYNAIIQDAYATNATSAAFYPLFPAAVGALSTVSAGLLTPVIAAQLINSAAMIAAITALLRIGRLLFGSKIDASGTGKYWLIALTLSAPAAFFFHVFYGEALFFALSLWAYLLALKRNWLGVGILLGILTATRLPSLLVVALCGLEYLRAYEWNIKKALNPKILWFALAPIGFIAYGTYLFFVRGNFLAMFAAYDTSDDWTYQVFNPNIFETLAKQGYQLARVAVGVRPFDTGFAVNILLPLLLIGLLIAASVYLIKKRGLYLPLGVYGLLAVVLFTLNSNIVSVHRYILTVLTLNIALLVFALPKIQMYRIPLTIFIVISAGIQFWLYWLFIGSTFAG